MRSLEQKREYRNRPTDIYGQPVFDKAVQWMKGQSFQQMVLEQMGIYMQNMKLYLTPYTKTNFKWVRDLNVSVKMTQYPEEEDTGENLCNLVLGRFRRTPKAWNIKKKLINWTLSKLKVFALQKNIKRQATDWEKIFAKHMW